MMVKDEAKLINDIVKSLSCDDDVILLLDFIFNKSKQNELLFFFKPECFLVDNQTYLENILRMTFEKFNSYNVEISGAFQLSGSYLQKARIMDRHYGVSNAFSRNASRLAANDNFLPKISDLIDIEYRKEYRILGGHEILQEFEELNEDFLRELWIKKKPVKICSGVYACDFLIRGEKIILFNGFFPSDLSYYYNTMHKIVILLLHSDTNWKKLRDNMIGMTFSEIAAPESIRGELFQNSYLYGIKHKLRNCVHLSGGSFESLFEINNFLSEINTDFSITETKIHSLMIESGFKTQDTKMCLQNPSTLINGKQVDLFSITENMNSIEAINIYKESFKKLVLRTNSYTAEK